MTLTEARKILGLGPDEDPRPHLTEFRLARERIAEMVRNAPNETLAERYQKGLIEFDKALAAVREYLEALGLLPRIEPGSSSSEPEPAGSAAEANTPEEETPEAGIELEPSRKLLWAAWTIVFLTIIGAGAFFLHFKHEEQLRLTRMVRIAKLEREGAGLIENRRWQEAMNTFAEMESLDPGSELALLGRRSIEAGMAEEQTQFLGYWTGQALAELDAGRLDEAQAAVNQVLERFPGEAEALAIVGRIAEARIGQARETAIAEIRKLLEDQQWQEAISAGGRLLAEHPSDEMASALLADANAGLKKQQEDRTRAGELLLMAVARDQGSFDQQALDWLREAAALDPENDEITARLEKMASYTRTLKVPGDFETPAEALAVARDRDRILLAEQTWKGPLIINAAVEVQGAGPGKTVIECPADEGSAVTIGPEAKGARISGITFRHETFLVDGRQRFAAALVRGGSATFVDCRFSDASGHGLAVIEQGQAVATRCRFSDNGWNGAAALGVGSLMEIRDSEALNNFEHGIESWEGAAIILINNRCEGNSRNGIHADNGLASATIEGNQLIANREFGIVLGSAGTGSITNNTARSNLLGGLVIRNAAAGLRVAGNQATLNKGPGLVLEVGLARSDYQQNTLSRNQEPQLLADALLHHPDEAQETSSTEPEPAPLSQLPEP